MAEPRKAITALTPLANGRVAVALDGQPWRELPAVVVARTLLRVGIELDRPRARELRRELRRAEALGVAARALRHRDLSAGGVAARLEHAGVAAPDAEEALATLQEVGWVDDARFATRRAEVLAERGWGDAAIAAELERQAVARDAADGAVAALPPEHERADAIVARRGAGARTAAYLARRGFGEDAVERAAGPSVAEDG